MVLINFDVMLWTIFLADTPLEASIELEVVGVWIRSSYFLFKFLKSFYGVNIFCKLFSFFCDISWEVGGTLLQNSYKSYLEPIRSCIVKENHIDSAVSEILSYRQTKPSNFILSYQDCQILIIIYKPFFSSIFNRGRTLGCLLR